MSLKRVLMLSTYGRLAEGAQVEVDAARAAALIAEGRAVEPPEEDARANEPEATRPPKPRATRRSRGGA